MHKKYFTCLLVTAVIAVVGVTYAFRPTPSLLKTTTPSEQTPAASAETESISVALVVEGSRHIVLVPRGSNVLDAMRSTQEHQNFMFAGREFPSLGFFVEEINSKRNADGYYWILYVNGSSSNTGVSQTTLQAGDTVEWKYEKGH